MEMQRKGKDGRRKTEPHRVTACSSGLVCVSGSLTRRHGCFNGISAAGSFSCARDWRERRYGCAAEGLVEDLETLVIFAMGYGCLGSGQLAARGIGGPNMGMDRSVIFAGVRVFHLILPGFIRQNNVGRNARCQMSFERIPTQLQVLFKAESRLCP